MNFRTIWTIIQKELRIYFNSPLAYVFIVVYLVVSGWLFFRGFFIANQATMREFFNIMPFLFLFFVPAITMRLWAQEKKMGTVETLLTFPVKDIEIVLGKFMSTLLFLMLTIVLSTPLAFVVGYLGDLDTGVVVMSYLATILLGASYLAIGLWVSSFTDDQIVAFIISILVCFILFISGSTMVLYNAPSFLVPILNYISLNTHFASMARGIIDTRDIIYYLIIISLFLYLNVKTVESRKR